MIKYRYIVAVLFLAITIWLLKVMQEEDERKLIINIDHLPDYTMNDFVATTTDKQGLVKRKFQANSMIHYQFKDTELQAPYLVLYRQGNPVWYVWSEHGTVSSDGNILWLLGDAHVQKYDDKGIALLKIVSRDIKVNIPQEYAETVANAVIYTENGVTTSVGMQVSLLKQQLKLLSQVKGKYSQKIN
jgi:LPS export ABC transporter protein LptC